MSKYNDIDFVIEDETESEEDDFEDQEWELLNIRWERENELLTDIKDIVNYNIEMNFEELRKQVLKKIHDNYDYIFYEEINSMDPEFKKLLIELENPNCSMEKLKEYMKNESRYIRSAVASNPKTTQDMLKEMHDADKNEEISAAIAAKDNCPKKIMYDINMDENTLGRIALSVNPNTDEKILNRIKNVNYTFKRLVLKNPACTSSIIDDELEDTNLVPYILLNPNCTKVQACYLIELCAKDDMTRFPIEFIDSKVREGYFDQTIIDFMANNKFVRNRMSNECLEYLDKHATCNRFEYETICENLFKKQTYPNNTLDFNSLPSGEYQVNKKYDILYSFPTTDIKYYFDYFGKDGDYVRSIMKEYGTDTIAFGEHPVAMDKIKSWVLSKLFEEGRLTNTGKIFRDIYVTYNNDKLVQYNEYTYNDCKFVTITGKSWKKLEPVEWQCGFNYFQCVTNLFEKWPDKINDANEIILEILYEDLKYVDPITQKRPSDEYEQMRLKLD